MLLEILIAILAGTLFGIFTGVTPGVHINMVCVIVLAFSPVLLSHFSVLSVLAFILAMSVTHTFLDVIPSIFLGAPDDATALGVLPGHRMLLKGRGIEAVNLTILGSLFGLILSVIIFVPLVLVVKFAYAYIAKFIGFIILGIAVFMIARDKNRCWSMVVFLLSGILGMVIFAIPNFKDPMFPLFSGLFGVSTLLYSIKDKNKIPQQKKSGKMGVDAKKSAKAIISGEFSGFLTAILPGIGASTAAVLSSQISRGLKNNGFLILVGTIGTVNFVLSLVAFYALEKARNGSIITVLKLMGKASIQISPVLIMLMLCVLLIAGSISVFLTVWISRLFCRLMAKVNYQWLVIGVIAFIILMVIVITGVLGFLVLVVSTALGIVPAITKVARTHAMGCLLVPVMFYFL